MVSCIRGGDYIYRLYYNIVPDFQSFVEDKNYFHAHLLEKRHTGDREEDLRVSEELDRLKAHVEKVCTIYLTLFIYREYLDI